MKFSDMALFDTSWPFLHAKSTENRLTILTACKAPVPQVSCLRGNHLSVILHSRITIFTFLSCSECSVSSSYFSCWHRKHHQHPRRCHWQSSSTTVGCHWQSSPTTVGCHWQSSSTTVGCHWQSSPTTVGCHWQSSSTTVGSGVRLPAACNASATCLFLTARRFSGAGWWILQCHQGSKRIRKDLRNQKGSTKRSSSLLTHYMISLSMWQP